jgi:putative ATP-binding cassette transporter
MRLFLKLIRYSWLHGLLSVVLGAVGGLASLWLIAIIHAALSQESSDSSHLAATFALLCVLVMISQVGSRCFFVRLSQSAAARLRFELCERILNAPLLGLETVGHHRLLNTLIGDVNTITQALAGLPNVCAKAMVLIAGIGYLASFSIPLAACTVFVAALGVLSYLGGNRIANRYLREAREDQDEVLHQLRAMIRGIKELKANVRRQADFVEQVLVPAETSMRGKMVTGQSIQGVAQSWGRLTMFIGIGLLIFVWPRLQEIDAATLTGYTLTILYLVFPLDGIVGWLPAMNRATISLAKIESLGLLIDKQEPQPSARLQKAFGTIELRSLSFSYESPGGEGFSLGPLNMQVRAREVLFVAGGNGSGKTTFAKLLTGLYIPDGGAVLLDGQPVSGERRADYRQLFSTVFVEGNLFDRLLGIDCGQREIIKWIELLGIREKVDLHSGRLLTDELSRGQHKRLALLVACLDDRPVFVFDEWAAEQDPGFKDIFYRKILPELKVRGRTVVAITHDDRYFFAADRVLELANGRIESASGTKVA